MKTCHYNTKKNRKKQKNRVSICQNVKILKYPYGFSGARGVSPNPHMFRVWVQVSQVWVRVGLRRPMPDLCATLRETVRAGSGATAMLVGSMTQLLNISENKKSEWTYQPVVG